MKDRKQYTPKHERDHHSYVIVPDGTYSLVAKYLIDNGMATTRANILAEAINLCFRAVSPLDDRNVRLGAKLLPEVFTLAKFYNDIYGDGKYFFHDFVETTKEVIE